MTGAGGDGGPRGIFLLILSIKKTITITISMLHRNTLQNLLFVMNKLQVLT